MKIEKEHIGKTVSFRWIGGYRSSEITEGHGVVADLYSNAYGEFLVIDTGKPRPIYGRNNLLVGMTSRVEFKRNKAGGFGSPDTTHKGSYSLNGGTFVELI